MSYSLRISVVNGTAVLDEQTGDVPDGLVTVAGHRDGTYESLSVSRQTTEFDPAMTASLSIPNPFPPAPAPTPTQAPAPPG